MCSELCPWPLALQKTVAPAVGDANMRSLKQGEVIQVRALRPLY